MANQDMCDEKVNQETNATKEGPFTNWWKKIKTLKNSKAALPNTPEKSSLPDRRT